MTLIKNSPFPVQLIAALIAAVVAGLIIYVVAALHVYIIAIVVWLIALVVG